MSLICALGLGSVAPGRLYPRPVGQLGQDDPAILPHQHRLVRVPQQPHRPPPEALPPPPSGMQRPDRDMGACSRPPAYPLARPPPAHMVTPSPLHAFPTSHSSSPPRLCQTSREGCSPPTASHDSHSSCKLGVPGTTLTQTSSLQTQQSPQSPTGLIIR